MGVITLAEFRTDVDVALGNKGIVDATLDRYINYGYYDLAGAIEFEPLTKETTTPTVSAQNYVTTPTDAIVVRLVRDATSDNLLGWIPSTEYFRRLQATTAAPTHWTRYGTKILLHPVPDAVYSLEIGTVSAPTVLAASGDVTVFPATFDPAVFMLAVHHGLLINGEEQRATAWLARAISYVGSRITESDYHEGGRGLGASVPRGMAALQSRLSAEGGK